MENRLLCIWHSDPRSHALAPSACVHKFLVGPELYCSPVPGSTLCPVDPHAALRYVVGGLSPMATKVVLTALQQAGVVRISIQGSDVRVASMPAVAYSCL